MSHTVSALFYLFPHGKSIADLPTIHSFLSIPPGGILVDLCKMLGMFFNGGQLTLCEKMYTITSYKIKEAFL
jgi:hypothetical protein